MAKVVKLHRQKAQPKFKYTLNEELEKLPRSTSIDDVITHLEKYDISRDEFYNDRKIPFGSKKSIPSDRLLIYAQVFSVSLDDLMNHQVKAKAIRENLNHKKFNSPLR